MTIAARTDFTTKKQIIKKTVISQNMILLYTTHKSRKSHFVVDD